jgi:hypothetical protein
METLGKHFKSLASTALQKHGFRQGDLLSHWSVVAGDHLAGMTAPERIKWPRNDIADHKGDGKAATLVLRCNPGRALDVQYQVPQLIERVNQFFGYRAIGSIKVIQAGKVVTAAPTKVRIAPQPSASVQAQIGKLENEDLRQALLRLGAHVEQG